jgi:hypothetical protein
MGLTAGSQVTASVPHELARLGVTAAVTGNFDSSQSQGRQLLGDLLIVLTHGIRRQIENIRVRRPTSSKQALRCFDGLRHSLHVLFERHPDLVPVLLLHCLALDAGLPSNFISNTHGRALHAGLPRNFVSYTHGHALHAELLSNCDDAKCQQQQAELRRGGLARNVVAPSSSAEADRILSAHSPETSAQPPPDPLQGQSPVEAIRSERCA